MISPLDLQALCGFCLTAPEPILKLRSREKLAPLRTRYKTLARSTLC